MICSFCVTLHLKDSMCGTCLQHKFPDFEKYLAKNLILKKIDSCRDDHDMFKIAKQRVG